MANRYFTQFSWSLEKNPVTLWARVVIGASGAPTLDSTNSKGIKSISRSSAGTYVVTFGNPAPNAATDTYNRLLFANAMFEVSGGVPAAPVMAVSAQSVSSAGTVTLVFSDVETPAATDPASGEVMYLEFKLKNSTAQ